MKSSRPAVFARAVFVYAAFAGAASLSLSIDSTAAPSENRKVDSAWSTNWTKSDHTDFACSVVDAGERRTVSYGQSQDSQDVESLRHEMEGSFVLIRMGSKRYSITDPTLCKEARTIVQPLVTLSGERAKVSAIQARLGDAKAMLGGKLGGKPSAIGRSQSSAALSERGTQVEAGVIARLRSLAQAAILDGRASAVEPASR